MSNLLVQNKSLSDNLAQCRSQNSSLSGQREQLNIVNVELANCNDKSQEMMKTIETLNSNLTRIQAQRDEFQIQVASMSSLQSQLNNCNTNAAQLREANANLSNF